MRTHVIIVFSLVLIVLLADMFAQADSNRRRSNNGGRGGGRGRDADPEERQVARGSGNRRRSNKGRDVDQDIFTVDDDEAGSPQARFLQEDEDMENDWFEEK
ncbi:uncharacterized protein LOC102804507 [Saccoglossus kowalevskii]|uniref:Uncharacterized protein LOC102804507 n=1 Tax=Saccoglossus kowalevskii TaxID=10224 RepID=A0ABM0MZP4_SACKO|nr:PREDICTED: uncharacterized protein LOC102804507 [Saccoglossus kowalevskii]